MKSGGLRQERLSIWVESWWWAASKLHQLGPYRKIREVVYLLSSQWTLRKEVWTLASKSTAKPKFWSRELLPKPIVLRESTSRREVLLHQLCRVPDQAWTLMAGKPWAPQTWPQKIQRTYPVLTLISSLLIKIINRVFLTPFLSRCRFML